MSRETENTIIEVEFYLSKFDMVYHEKVLVVKGISEKVLVKYGKARVLVKKGISPISQ